MRGIFKAMGEEKMNCFLLLFVDSLAVDFDSLLVFKE